MGAFLRFYFATISNDFFLSILCHHGERDKTHSYVEKEANALKIFAPLLNALPHPARSSDFLVWTMACCLSLPVYSCRHISLDNSHSYPFHKPQIPLCSDLSPSLGTDPNTQAQTTSWALLAAFIPSCAPVQLVYAISNRLALFVGPDFILPPCTVQ